MLGVVETFVVTHRHSRSLEFTPLSRPNIIVMHCNYVSKLYFSEIFSTSNEWYAIHIWDWVRSPSRSLKMALFDRSCIRLLLVCIVSIAVSRTILELFDVKECRDGTF